MLVPIFRRENAAGVGDGDESNEFHTRRDHTHSQKPKHRHFHPPCQATPCSHSEDERNTSLRQLPRTLTLLQPQPPPPLPPPLPLPPLSSATSSMVLPHQMLHLSLPLSPFLLFLQCHARSGNLPNPPLLPFPPQSLHPFEPPPPRSLPPRRCHSAWS